MKRLKDKCVLITGGTSGIGAETARLFAEEGARVVITGRSVKKGQALAKSLGNSVEFFEADVYDEEQIRSSIDHTKKELGKIDVLFNNAGGPADAPLDQITQEDIDKGVRLLLSSVMLGTRYVIEPMKENSGGVIISNSSIAGSALSAGRFDLLGAQGGGHSFHKNVGH